MSSLGSHVVVLFELPQILMGPSKWCLIRVLS